MVVPTPMARPSTAAIIGLVTLGRRRMKSSEGAGMPLPPADTTAAARRRKSLMSLPAENTPPEPMNTVTAMASLLSAASSASDMALYIGPVNAFFLSARRKRISCTPSATLISISWVISSSLRSSASLVRRKDGRHAAGHLGAQRLQAGGGTDHHLEFADAAVRIEPDHVHALERLVADAPAELEYRAVVFGIERALVGEIGECQQRLLQELRDQRRALIGSVR